MIEVVQYAAGLIAADGYVSGNGKWIYITLQVRDKPLLDELADLLGGVCVIRDANAARLRLGSDFVRFKSAPPLVSDKDYLRGLVDGDGCLFWDEKPDGRRYPNIMLCYATAQLWIRDLWLSEMESRGFPTRSYEGSTQGRILLRKSADARELAEELYAQQPCLQRKLERAKEFAR